MLGFSDLSSFSRWFKRRFWRSVPAWRAINQTSGKSQTVLEVAWPVALLSHTREFRAAQRLAQVIQASGHAVQGARLSLEFCGQGLVKHILGHNHRNFGRRTADNELKILHLTYEDLTVEFKEISFAL
jgi:hypothetical protein